MGRVAFFVFSLCLTVAPFAVAEEWSKTFNITGKPDLRVETSDADIHVDTWDKNTIEATVTTQRYKIGDDGIKVLDHQSGDSVEIEVRFPHHRHFNLEFGTHRVDVEIHMPRQGRVSIHTGDGAVRVNGCKGEIEVQTRDGHQDIEAVDGALRAHAGDGHIRAEGRFDALEISTGDGRIEARVQPGSGVTSSWDLHADDGSITLQLPQSFAADVDLHTNDGHISVDMPVAVEGELGRKNIHGKLNGGGKLLTVHTGDGSIRLEKS